MTKELKLKEKLKQIKKIKVFGVDENNNIVSKFYVNTDAKTPVAKCFRDVAMRVFDHVEERKEKKNNAD